MPAGEQGLDLRQLQPVEPAQRGQDEAPRGDVGVAEVGLQPTPGAQGVVDTLGDGAAVLGTRKAMALAPGLEHPVRWALAHGDGVQDLDGGGQPRPGRHAGWRMA